MTEMPPPDATGDVPLLPPRDGRRGLVVGAVATIVAVVAGAAVWATVTLSGGGRQPDEVVPKTTFAYLKIDLDPAAGQKLAARSFLSKIPSLKDKVGDGTDDVFDDLLAEVIDDGDIDYRTDVQPWFDRRAAVAAFASGGKTHVVIAVRSKDDAKARESLDNVVSRARVADRTDDSAYRITKGYAILGDTPGVEAAVRDAAKESLRDNATYRADVDRLDGDQVAVAWADVAGSFESLKDAFPYAGLVPAAVSDQVKGRVVAGLHLTADYAEVQGLNLGFDKKSLARPTGMDLLAKLPSDTAAAVAVNGLGGLLTGGDLPLDQLLGGYLKGTGLSITDDVLPLLRSRVVVAASGGREIGILAEVDDAAKAETTGARLAALLGIIGVPATSRVNGDTFVLAAPESYGATLAKGGNLGQSPKFAEVMGDLSGVTDAVYVDVAAVSKALPDTFGAAPEGMAFGMVGGARDGEGFFRARLTAG